MGFQVVTTEGPVSHHEKVDTEEPPTSPSSSLKVNTSPNTTKQDLNHASVNNSGFSCAMMDPWMSDFYVPDCESFTWLEVIVIDTWQGKVLLFRVSPFIRMFVYCLHCRLPSIHDALCSPLSVVRLRSHSGHDLSYPSDLV